MDYSVSILYRPGSLDFYAFNDVAKSVGYALAKNGHEAELRYGDLPRDNPAIIFGLHDMPDLADAAIPEGSVVYNLEPVIPGSRGYDPVYLDRLRKFQVWDYSERNIATLRRDFSVPDARYVPLGYMPQMHCLRDDFPKDIDVLFYGMLNGRRKKIIRELKARGLKVAAGGAMLGAERDFMIARSRLVLNLHYYTPGVMEIVRVSYLLANAKAVVCERNADTEVPALYEGTCCFAPYERIADAILSLLADEEALARQARRGFELFSQLDYAGILGALPGMRDTRQETAVFMTPPAAGGNDSPQTPSLYDISRPSPARRGGFRVALPRVLNVGSGRHFRPDCLNVDIFPPAKPDILLDVSQPLDWDRCYESKRFGPLRLQAASFDAILAGEMLEHVPDLVQTMRTFLELLKEGGRLRTVVPYDLSLGAWQDPTHRRGMNENSWKYFGEWCWYLDWQDFCFELESIDYGYSKFGRKLRKLCFTKGMLKRLRGIPRAVESMSVSLVKRPVPHEVRLENAAMFRKHYVSDADGL